MKKANFKEWIVFENEDYLVINKPPFISTLDDRQVEGRQNVIRLAKQYVESAQVCHRLDRETSGILAIAKNAEAYRHLSIQFQDRKVTKVYHAIVGGIQEWEEIQVKKPIFPLKTGGVKIDYERGKEAETYFSTLEIFKQHTLIECRPVTGRMHQIRIHLTILQAPIVGDTQYGGQPLFLSEIKKKFNLKKNTEEQALIQRFPLHAFQLEFELMNGDKQIVQAPYPKDFRAVVNQLRKYI